MGGVDDADVQVLDHEQDVGSGAGSADADVAKPPPGVAEGDTAVLSMVSARTPLWVSAVRSPGAILRQAA